jgi:hypothetical protein
MSGITWGKPVKQQGTVALYRRAMSYGNTRDTVEWLVATHVEPARPYNVTRQFNRKRDAVEWFNYCVEHGVSAC